MQRAMSNRFRSVDRQMPYLLPPSLDEWLPEGHLARFVVETVETLDTTALEEAYDSVAVRYVAAGQHPDHDTICTFRRRRRPSG